MDMLNHNNNNDFYWKNAITKSPSINMNNERVASKKDIRDDVKYHRFVIDSAFRDTNIYPNPNNYVMPLGDEMNDIISVELVYMVLPNCKSPTITNNFNTLNINYSSNNYNVVIGSGDFTGSNLSTQINNSITSNNINIGSSYDPDTNKFNFTSSNPFSIDFSSNIGNNNLSYLLGFPKNNILSTSNANGYTLTSLYNSNPYYNNYSVMYIDFLDINKSDWPVFNKSFALINDGHYSLNDSFNIKKYCNPPISRMNELRIKFYDKFGNFMEFDNVDHHFELIFTTSRQKLKYTM